MFSDHLSIQLYSLRDYFHTPRELGKLLQEVSAAGYRGIELACVDNMCHEDVVRAVEESGLTGTSSHIGWDRFQTELDTVIRELKDFHCSDAVIPIVIDRKYHSADGVLQLASEIRALSERLRREGITLHYHNHNYEMCRFRGKTWLRHLLDELSKTLY